MKKKLVSVLLCVAMVGTMVVGCGSDKGSDKKSDKSSSGSSKEKVLKVAALESAYGADMWKDVAKAFEETEKGVKVELTVDKKLEDVISPAMKAGDYPDVVHLATGREAGLTETLTKEKGLLPLTDVMDMTIPGEDQKVKDKIMPGFLDTLGTNPYGDGVTYYAPMFYAPCGLFYNADLLKQKGWEVPKTWDEMWALGDKAKKEGIYLFTYPTPGYFDAFTYALLESSGGVDFYNDVMTYKKDIWETPQAKAVLDLIAKLADYTEPTTVANANDDNFTKNQQLILDNKAIFCPNGSWLPGEMKDAPRADGFEWGFSAIPSVSKDQKPSSFTFFEQMWIPKEAKDQDLAKEWVAFMYSDKAADIFAKAGAAQPIPNIADKLSKDNQLFYHVYDNDAATPVMGGFASTPPVEGVSISDSLFKAVNSIMSKDKTVAQWQKDVNDASNKLGAAMDK